MRLHDWEARLVGQLTADQPADETRGIAVYRNARRAILRNALAGAYPVCRALVGEDCFDAQVKAALETPSLYDEAIRYMARHGF
ncbi:putative DNA-binding domain-containing protein, partial [Ralstonia pseudosolanacearum]|uniref:HvfC/BufC family peptide modification chaperone n=1 Tax=Ralstonia pseudosolanacearum TaxID=1310165 RepID=UPI003CFA31AF